MIDAVEDYFGKFALRYALKHASYGCSNIFQLFDTSEKPNHFVASRRRWLESQGSNDAGQKNGRNEWYDLGYQGAKAEAPPCPNSALQTSLPQQSLSSAREEEYHWEVREERRRRRIAFENLAKGMLSFLDNCNEEQVGIVVLQERVEVPLQFGISTQKVAQQAMNEDGQKIYEVFWQAGEDFFAGWARWEAQRERLSRLGKKVSRHKS